ncbi:uncharacterized protein LOC143982506 isoform X12 [Lithobates pipiens]
MFSKNDPPDIRHLSQRLGKHKVFSQESPSDPPALHRNLSQRLGKRKVFSQESSSGGAFGHSSTSLSDLDRWLTRHWALGTAPTLVSHNVKGLNIPEKRSTLLRELKKGGESFPAVKKTLSERLGKKISPVIAPDARHKKIQVPRLLKDRLGLAPEQNSTETVSKETDQDTNSQTNNSAAAADTKTTVNFETPASTLEKKKITEKVDSDKTFGIQSVNNADFTDTQKITQHEVGCSVKPSKIISVNKSKVVMKKQSPTKTILKQKAQQKSPVAEVKPMKTTLTSTDKERTTVLLSTAESLVSQHVRSMSPKHLKESSQVPASDPGHSGMAPTVVNSRRASIALLGKPSILTEDDFDELIWDISDGKLDEEIDLDPSKDEDDLLMELSEMIDS